MWNNLQNQLFPSDSSSRSQYIKLLQSMGLPTDKKYWWVEYPRRAVEEIFLMNLNTNATVENEDDNLVWFETIVTDFGQTHDLIIVSEPGYPHKMPKAFVPDTTTHIHKMDDESLCLFDTCDYSSKMTILEIRNQACAWCFAYDAYIQTGQWPAAEKSHF